MSRLSRIASFALAKLQTGVDILHVPYKGSGPATADAVGGQVQVTYASVASVLRFVQAGRLRALAVTSKFARIAKAGNIHAE